MPREKGYVYTVVTALSHLSVSSMAPRRAAVCRNVWACRFTAAYRKQDGPVGTLSHQCFTDAATSVMCDAVFHWSSTFFFFLFTAQWFVFPSIGATWLLGHCSQHLALWLLVKIDEKTASFLHYYFFPCLDRSRPCRNLILHGTVCCHPPETTYQCGRKQTLTVSSWILVLGLVPHTRLSVLCSNISKTITAFLFLQWVSSAIHLLRNKVPVFVWDVRWESRVAVKWTCR